MYTPALVLKSCSYHWLYAHVWLLKPVEIILLQQFAGTQPCQYLCVLIAAGPATLMGEYDLTQSLTGTADNGTAATRGPDTTPMSGTPNNVNTTIVQVGTPGGQ